VRLPRSAQNGDVNPLLHNLGHNLKRPETKNSVSGTCVVRIQSFLGYCLSCLTSFTQALCGSEQLLADLRLSVVHGFSSHFVTVSQALGAHEFDVGNADEAE